MNVKSLMRRAACVLCLAMVAGLMFALPAYAQKGDDYTYQVRVFGGNEGTYNGDNPYVISDIKAGTEVSLSTSNVDLGSDSKYYAKGFRISGQDELTNPNFKVTEDVDIVVAYGVKGDMVSYTITFVDNANGNAIENDEGVTSKTFYGKKGDKPVVAYEYVPGYVPLYRNITGTLGDEGTNNWELRYNRIEGTAAATTTTTPAAPAAAAAAPAAAANAAGGTAAAPAAAAPAAAAPAAANPAAGENAEGGQATPGEAIPANENPAAQEPGEVIDVDENPLAGNGQQGTEPNESQAQTQSEDQGDQQQIPVALIFAIAAAVVVAAGVIAVLLRRRNME